MASGAMSAVDIAREARRQKANRYWDTTSQFLPANLRAKKVTAYTELAKKYSHPIGQWYPISDHRILRNTGKSGITPLPRLDPEEMITDTVQAEREKREELEIYQRRRLNGFTPAELHDMEALAALIDEPMRNNLENDVHPIFERRWWMEEKDLPKHQGLIPLLGDYEGFWVGSNDMVWAVMEPCLRLATVMLTCSSTYPWLDAIFKGPLTRTPGEGGKDDVWSVNERTPAERNTDAEYQDLQEQLIACAGRIRFTFQNSHTHWVSSIEQLSGILGLTMTGRNWMPEIVVAFSVEPIQVLLRDDLTDAERLMAQHRVAQIAIHEFGHSAWQLVADKRGMRNKMRSIEPNFAPETVMELGFSFVQSVFGGEAEHAHGPAYHRGGPGLAGYAVFKQSYFEREHARRIDRANREAPDTTMASSSITEPVQSKPSFDTYPVPFSWVKSLFQPATWNVVMKNLGTASHMGPCTVGTRIFPMFGQTPDWYTYLTSENPNQVAAALGLMKVDPQLGKMYGLDRVKQVEEIYSRLGMSASARSQLRASQASSEPTLGQRQAMITANKWDTLPDEEEIPLEDWKCPRYQEIFAYLCSNRAPLELALDTMTILPFTVFYRYIRDRGGITLSAMELWNFLGLASKREELFLFMPYPGPGLVIRLEVGWPPGDPFAFAKIPEPTFVPTAESKNTIMEIVRRSDFPKAIFGRLDARSMQDIDFETLRRLVTGGGYKIRPVPFKATIIQCVREVWDFNTEFTLGPEGIVRLTHDLRTVVAQEGGPILAAQLADIEAKKNKINSEWRRKQLQGI
ncbi:uncharacterized protein LY89DRAFT_785531 [Mollisia scopiformis]|uniref:Uncharacterized protein n=1 Tax=Mollisia scopiformis TaxID=149040 RepID=A0A194WYG2_MOLSC|nr:uncharacterized protein LY89DRAFT_785531 [Mollisia scopiformis]KUJ13001.1 hypothetical protein LY89DRAFT_785531 [Mollisia scopiformis]